MNELSGIKVEFHIAQSFPVTCLNRDDLNAPKTAVVGGVTRARVSSQCWKRQVRLAFKNSGIPTAMRTRFVKEQILEYVDDKNNEVLGKRAEIVAGTLVDKKTLVIFSPDEFKFLAAYIMNNNIEKSLSKAEAEKLIKDLEKIDHGKTIDVALFGRMLAQASTLDVEGAASFSHAITTHRVDTEVDFFTAIDDADPQETSGHLGTSQFTSGTYYRYVSVDLGILYDHLGSKENVIKAVKDFTTALFLAVPSAKQKTFAGYSPWDYAHVFVRKGQNLQLSFEQPVKASGEGYLKPTIAKMEESIKTNKALMGSLFGQIGEYIYGDTPEHGYDELIAFVNQTLGGI